MPNLPALVRRQRDFDGLFVDIKADVHGRLIRSLPSFGALCFPYRDIIHDTKDGELLFSVNHCVWEH